MLLPSPALQLSFKKYETLEIYRFNLVVFLTTPEFHALPDQKKLALHGEVAYINMVLEILEKLLIPKYWYGKKIIAWKTENQIEYDFVFEFSSVYVASRALGISETIIVTLCQNINSNQSIKDYYFSYKENFNRSVKDIKF